MKADRPKFLLVFGMARSGTSWIGKIFDSHPLTLYKHEPDRALPEIPAAPPLTDASRYAPAVRRFFAQLPTIDKVYVAGSLPVFPKQYRFALAQQIHRLSVLCSLALSSSANLKLAVLQCAAFDNPEIQIVWKSIDSLGRLGTILEVMDDCRAIWITRHPCASISSTLRGQVQHKFSSEVAPSEDYGMIRILLKSAVRNRGLRMDHLQRLLPVERMAWIWVLANEKAEFETRENAHCTRIRYEDVCLDPSGTMKRLFTFSGLNWDRQTTEFLQASTLGTQPGKFDQLTQDSRRYYGIFRDPIKAADRWKSEMKEEDIERIYRILGESDLGKLYPASETISLQARALLA